MNASTFSGRVTGSTFGQSLHGDQLGHRHLDRTPARGANEEVLDMLDEVGSVANVKAWVEEAVAKKKKFMGVNSPRNAKAL